MAVRLRFAMHGPRHNRIFHIVAIEQSMRRNAKPIETLGVFDPHLRPGETTKRIEWSVDRIKYWLGVGAQPSKTLQKLFDLVSNVAPASQSCSS